ncbi:hypothetical protein B5807_07039 [Epicoccum nigrum]|uniref:Uncharacterized protein n=1 Tax=Epicoccum nigrum TaxID=105696 RepID=A0A1Y2LXZ0_EPING|nr:hypothetical protein B5807_07039 [Epicoccum nigrum]
MARVEVNRGEEPMTPSFDKEIRDATTDSRISRRNSSSTTGSGKPIPPGHWTLPISGNCPRCRHHHHSIKVHIKNTEEASGLVDVHCEKCNKLWIGPGTLNATRISLASNETIDPPPEDPEVRTALYRAIRSVTRVAILSPTLPGIQEGTPGLTRELSTRSLMQHGDQEPVGSQYPLTSSRAATSPAASSPKRIEKSKRIGTTATFSRHLLRVKSRVSRMTKYLREGSLVTSSDNRELSQNATTNSESWSMGVGPASLRSHVEHPATDTRPAAALEAQSPLCTIDPEAIGRMTPEQRFVYFRSRITAFSKQYSAIPKTSPQGSDHSYPGSVSLDMATIRDHLAGIGHGYDQRLPNDYLRNSDPALPRQSLQISDTRTSEADTVVV